MRNLFDFKLKEITKKSRGESESKGVLILSFTTRGFYNKEENLLEYKDTDKEPLEMKLGNIIYDIFFVANKLQTVDELESRELHRRWEEEERQRRLEQMREGELEEVKLLQQAVSDWDKAQKIRRFADGLEAQIYTVKD